MKKTTLIFAAIFTLGVAGCETVKNEQGGGLIDPAKSSGKTMPTGEMAECPDGADRCETGGGLIDPVNSEIDQDCDETDPRCETGGGLIDPSAGN